MLRFFKTIVLLIFVVVAYAQGNEIRITITDSITTESISNCHLSINGNQIIASNSIGLIAIDELKIGDLLEFQHISYHKRTISFDGKNKNIKVKLLNKSYQLTEIVVSDKIIKENLTNQKSSIIDYEFIDEGIICVEKTATRKGNYISLKDLEGQELYKQKIDFAPLSLYKSPTGKIYVESDDLVYDLYFDGNQFVLGQQIDLSFFKTYIEACKALIDHDRYYIVRTFNGIYEQVALANFESEDFRTLWTSYEESQVANFREQMPSMAFAVESPVLQINNTADNEKYHNETVEMDFYYTVFYKNENPLFISSYKKQLLIFDHNKSKMVSLEKGEQKSVNEISYHKLKNWKKTILEDQKNEKYYTYTKKGSKLNFYEIDISSGEVYLSFKLKEYFMDNIKIHDGVLYYLEDFIAGNLNNRLVKVRLP